MMRDLLRRLIPRGGIRRDLTMLVGATAIGTGLYLLILPILTRLYAPDAFGELVVFVAVVAVLLVVSSWRYEAAIPIASDSGEARALSVLSLGLVVTTALVATGVATVVSRLGLLETQIPRFGLLVGAGVLFGGVVQVIVSGEMRANRYGAVASMRIVQPASTGVAQLVFSGLTRSGMGLVGGDVIGRGVAAATLIVLRPAHSRGGSRTRWPAVRSAAARFRRFPQFSAPASLLNAAGLHLPVVVVGALFGLTTAGLLGLTQRILGMASILVGRSLTQVYIGRASEHIRAADFSNLSQLIRQMTRWLTAIFGVPFLIVALFAPFVAEQVLGPDWRTAGEFARLLAPAYFAQIAVVPMSSTLNLLERQPLQLAWDMFRLTAVMGAIAVTYLLGFSTMVVVGAFSVAQIVSYGLMYGLILYATGDARTKSSMRP